MAENKLSGGEDLHSVLCTITDPRVERTRQHNLVDILFIALCAVISGEDTFTGMAEFGQVREKWFRRFLKLPNGIPSHDTFNRVFAALDPEEFLGAFVRWTEGVRRAFSGEVVALDGKALRRAMDAGQSAPVVVGAWAAGAGISLGQVAVEDKSNEIKAVPALLEALELKGCIVTADAMGCQKEVAAKVREKGAHYALALKGNHPFLHQAAASYLGEMARLGGAGGGHGAGYHEEEPSTGHGRREVRRCWACEGLAEAFGEAVPDLGAWKDLRSVAMVESERTAGGRTTVERRYYLTSLPPDAREIGRAARSHWGIENSLHWVLDVTFREDESRARQRNAAQNLSALRRLAHNVIKTADPGSKKSVRLRMKRASWDPDYLAEMIGQNLDA